ncbi:MAG: sodium:solute symporter family protein [Bacteroidales bacterium]|nr:sodium:solute symporter family protein [Bacteroidales bacterium]
MGKLTNGNLIMLIVYALICVGIGLWSSRRQKEEDYLIAGRKMSLYGFMASVVASYIGGAAIVAYSAFVYQFGLAAIMVFVGTGVGFLIFIPYALKLRKISYEKKFYTLSDWFYYKYNKKVGLISAIILFVVYFGMLLNQFIAGSSILHSISGWSYETALIFSSVIITIYLMAGGFRSVIKTDMFQYIVLLVLFVLVGYLVMNDGADRAVEMVERSKMNVTDALSFIFFGVFIIFQSAEYWQRVYAAKSAKVVRRGFIGSSVLVLITGLALSFIGMAARTSTAGLEPEQAIAYGLSEMLPQGMLGFGLVLIFAAIMSSADTIIFVLASSIAEDYFGHLSKKQKTPERLMRQTRLFVLIFGITGFALAWIFRDIIEVLKFITGLGFTIIPGIIASFHWNISSRSMVISFLSGIVYIVAVILLGFLKIEAAVASLLVSGLALFIAHQISRKKHSKLENESDKK